MKKLFFTLSLGLIMLCNVSVVKADLVEQWNYSVEGYFFDFEPNKGTQGTLSGTSNTEHTFTWENQNYTGYSQLTWGLPSGSAANSGVSLFPSPEEAIMETNKGWYDAMTLRHDNNQLSSGSVSLAKTKIFLDMIISEIDGEVDGDGNPYSRNFNTVLDVLFYETVNSGNGTAETDQDIFVVINIADTYEQFNYNGVDYEISFLSPWSGIDNPFTALPEWAQEYVANQTGSGTTFYGFVTKEWDVSEIATKVRIDSPHAPTPEPGTMLLMGIGLVGLGYIARKRKA